MQLDFTGLNNIAQKIAIKDFEEDPVEATESPTEEANKEYQTNIRRSGELRTDILKGVKAGQSAHTLLLKAVECISNMTGDKLFYTQIEKDLKAIYGEAFLDDIPLEWELKEVELRLDRLREAYKRETTSPDSKHRIETAIREHEAQVATLKGLLERASKTELKKVI